MKPCPDYTPGWFIGHWRDWHRGHGCSCDDGMPRSARAVAEISQHTANRGTGFLTDAELSHLRARTTSGDTLLVRALDELRARRAEVQQRTAPADSTDELHAQQAEVQQRTAPADSTSTDELRARRAEV